MVLGALVVFMFFTWIIFCFVVGAVGSSRKLGFAEAFFISLFLSPLVGLIFALTSKNKKAEKYEREMLETQKGQQAALANIQVLD